MEFSFAHRISKKIFFNTCIFYKPILSDRYPYAFTAKAGFLAKLKMIGNFYFVPAINVYEYRLVYRYVTGEYGSQNIISAGPEIAFEFAPSKKISIPISLLELSYGRHNGGQQKNYWSSQLHKLLGAGVKYNFGK